MTHLDYLICALILYSITPPLKCQSEPTFTQESNNLSLPLVFLTRLFCQSLPIKKALGQEYLNLQHENIYIKFTATVEMKRIR